MEKVVIGFLAARQDEPYQHAVWSGAVEEAERIGASIVFFSGQRVRSPVGYEALDNIAYDIAARSHVAGLAIMTNVIGTYLKQEELLQFITRFKGVPVVSVGVNIPGVVSVRINNQGGMIAVADHLVQVHKRRRFLFLAGPAEHVESIDRQREFSQRLDELLGSKYDLQIEYCNFQEEEAYETTRKWFCKEKPFDAVVAANDLMALGALRALSEGGISVPEEVSVTGFDDTEDSRFSIPSLTTVRQGTHELGRQAIRCLGRQLGIVSDEREDSEARISFIIRESCGCSVSAFSEPVEMEYRSMSGGIDTLEALSQEVNTALARGRNPATLKPQRLDPKLKDQVLLIIAEGITKYQTNLRRSAERRARVLQEIESALVASFSLPDILSQVAHGTETLGISACWLVLFESKDSSLSWARLVLASEEGNLRILTPYGLRFRTSEILPGGLSSRWVSYVCEPLRFGEERLGYLICTANSDDRRVFEALRDQVSSAIKGAMLMSAERDRERRLAHEVRLRTMELYATNKRLREEIKRRSGLERELLEISNDIMARIGRDIHDDLCQDIAGIGLMAATLEGSLRRLDFPEASDAANSASAIALAASRTAAQAKGIARGLYPAELEAKGLVEAVSELVKAARERSPSQIRLEVTPGFMLKNSEKALQLYRIIQEALNNAVSHARANEIVVALRMDREAVQVEVADDGIGIPERMKSGRGMGLRIMKYRASVIGGELRIRSKDRGSIISCRVAR